ncbi:dachshund family transcription factor isoform X2 [Arctopsyche grandis]|uniref:dachshund family transcription factor isoform X2 n=1 Tax=Arctopsyche grandis TaxID=121162 RepID=UPI00406D8091
MEPAVDSASSGSERSASRGSHSDRSQSHSHPHSHRTPPPDQRRRSPLAPLLPLSPAGVGVPGGLLPPRLPHLPPPGLGLLGSLQMMHHASPLELMAAAHHHAPPRSYNSPPPISSSDPAANECKLVDYRGQKVAAFIIQGETMLCLPQAFELFLKHLVGGLHTVYTKLKRLDIVPLVCNVEQVRILRGLGAIQPGVNRCKLLSCKDFDVLYRDCTTARPGRPPKRASLGLSLAAAHLPAGHPFKKHRLENGEYSPYENGHLGADISRLEKSPLLANGYNAPPTHLGHMGFMHAPHALLSPGMPPHGMPRPDGSIIKGQPNMPNMEALARSGIWENCRAAYEDIVKHLERMRDERGDMDRALALDNKTREGSQNGTSGYYRPPLLPIMTDNCSIRRTHHSSGSSNGHSPVLNLSKSGGGGGGGMGAPGGGSGGGGGRSPPLSDGGSPSPPSAHSARDPDERDNLTDDNASDVDDHDDKDDHDTPYNDLSDGERDLGVGSPSPSQALNYSALGVGGVAPGVGVTPDAGVCSTETLLRNIQGLLKVAADNARQQERQISYEKAELKMDVLREREVKDNLERQLVDEQKMRLIYQKRLKKERRARQRAQEQLEAEMKRRSKIEDALKASGAPAEVLRIVTGEILDTISSSESSQQRDNGNTGVNIDGQQNQGSQGNGNGNVGGNGGGGARPGSPPCVPREGAPPPPAPPLADKQWNYPAATLDLMTTGAAFWQNYSESLAQEIELERKSRAQALERDVKSPLGERAGYYKSSVLFSSAT